jgi:hypothetical protein
LRSRIHVELDSILNTHFLEVDWVGTQTHHVRLPAGAVGKFESLVSSLSFEPTSPWQFSSVVSVCGSPICVWGYPRFRSRTCRAPSRSRSHRSPSWSTRRCSRAGGEVMVGTAAEGGTVAAAVGAVGGAVGAGGVVGAAAGTAVAGAGAVVGWPSRQSAGTWISTPSQTSWARTGPAPSGSMQHVVRCDIWKLCSSSCTNLRVASARRTRAQLACDSQRDAVYSH